MSFEYQPIIRETDETQDLVFTLPEWQFLKDFIQTRLVRIMMGRAVKENAVDGERSMGALTSGASVAMRINAPLSCCAEKFKMELQRRSERVSNPFMVLL